MFNPSNAGFYVLLVLFMQILTAFALAFIGNYMYIPLFAQLIISSLISFILPTILYKLATGVKTKQILRLKPIGTKNILYIIGLSITMQPLMGLASFMSSIVFENTISQTVDILQGESVLPIVILTMAIFPAVCEEICFRGVVEKNLSNVSMVKACLMNGLYFGIVHLSAQQFLYAFFAGAILCYMVRITGSIFSSILAHFTINLCQVVMSYINNFVAATSQITVTPSVSPFLWLIVLLISSFTAFILIAKSFTKFNVNTAANQDTYDGYEGNLWPPSFFAVLFFYIYIIVVTA